MLFGKKIDATRHKNFVPKIPFVGRFAYATKEDHSADFFWW